ncbi:MAG: hypothetical protein QOF60_3188, partial [Actinomycetota bacterium]|nr:hypothetical protein [Actinomycetota bacterium]
MRRLHSQWWRHAVVVAMASALLAAGFAVQVGPAAAVAGAGTSPAVPAVTSPPTDSTPMMPEGSSTAVPVAAVPADQVAVAPASHEAWVPPSSAHTPPKAPIAAPGKASGFVPGKSVEDVSARTEFAKTFKNPDGTSTAKISATPKHYQTAKGWQDIDSSLVAEAGGFRNKANTFSAHFDNLAAGVRIDTPAGQISMEAVGSADVVPTQDDAHRSVTYRDAWPNVDLRYRPSNDGVKEDIVLRDRPAQGSFSFNIVGAPLVVTADGGLALAGPLAGKWAISPPVVLDAAGRPIAAAQPRYTVSGKTVTVTVDGAWLAALPADAFPITIDPSLWSVGATNSQAYVGGPGGAFVCAPCDIRVGQPTPNDWTSWRSTAYFPYEDLLDKHIVGAELVLDALVDGTASPTGIEVYHGSYDWPSLGEYLGTGVADGFMDFSSEELRSFYDNATEGGYALKFIGQEDYYNYTFKEFSSFELFLDYSSAPYAVSPSSPANGAQLHTLNDADIFPRLAVNPTTDPDGDDVYYYFRLTTGADAETGVVDECPWQLESYCDVGPLAWNQTYYWHVYVSDEFGDQTNPDWVSSFRPVETAPQIAQPMPSATANGALAHSPVLDVSSSDAEGDVISYYYRVSTNANAETNPVYDSGWLAGTNQLTVPALQFVPGTTYYWHVYTSDGFRQTDPNWVRSFTMTNSGPPTPAPSSPAADSVVVQTNLSFTSSTVTDPDSPPDAVKYQFQIATGPDGQSGRMAMSQWLGTTTWTPPPGTFADGGTYSWIVRAQDPFGVTTPWSAARKVKVDFRLGQQPNLPFDSFGPGAVNLSNGNLVVSAGGPSFPTVGGPVGVSFTYNSQAPRVQGLTGDYYQDSNSNGVIDAGEPRLLHRIDPQLSFDWGAPGDGPNPGIMNPEHWVAHWDGAIRVPALQDGSYVIDSATTDDAVKVTVNGTQVMWANAPGAAFTSASFPLSSSASTPIQLDYVQVTGPEYLHLKIRKATDPASAAMDIPSDWLTTVQPSLPDGWSRSGDSMAQASYTAVRPVNASTTAVVDATGADHLYSNTGSGWKPPEGEEAVLTQRPDGTWTLLGDDGYLYRFTVEGRLQDGNPITSPSDDLHPGAPTYTYATLHAGGPVRLTRITDASGRTTDLTYGPSGSCPTGTGFDASAPADMLCKVTYTGYAGGATELYYSGGHLARLLNYASDPGANNPRGDIVDFGYNSDGLLTQVRDTLTNDLIAAGSFTDPTATTHMWLIGYDNDATPAKRKVTSITAPAPSVAGARPAHTYTYTPATGLPSQTDVHIAGVAETGSRPYARRVALDANGHATSDYDTTGIAVDTVWDLAKNRATKKVDHHYQADPVGGLVTTFFYDGADRLAETYGPAPAAEFDVQGRSASAPHSTTGFDEGIDGLAAAWFDNADLALTPKAHTTVAPDAEWGVASPAAGLPADNFSARLTGEITLPSASPITVDADNARVVVDDKTLLDTWGAATYPEIPKSDGASNYWKLDDGAGTSAADAMGNPAATAAGAIAFTQAGATGDGRTGASLAGGYLDIGDGYSDFSQGLTLEAWVYPTGSGSFERILDLGNGAASDNIVLTRVGTSNDLGFYVFRGGTQVAFLAAPGALVANSWQHVMVTMDVEGAITIYRNGIPVATGSGQLPNSIWRTSNYVGKSNWAGDAGFSGGLDDIALYGHALLPGRAAARVAAAGGTMPSLSTSSVLAGTHRLRVDYQERTGAARLHVTAPGATTKPRYNLATTATDPDGKVTTNEYIPEMSLATATTVDPAGLNLRSTTTYEPAGTGYWRPKATTLPAGTTTTSSYYGEAGVPATADNPCTQAVEAVDQAGALQARSGPDPDGAGPGTPRVETFVYDAAGRAVASQVNSQGWSCTTYDYRGRVSQHTDPAFGNEPARTTSYNHAVAGNPLVTNVHDDTVYGGTSDGTVTTTTDWLGRTTAYRDVWANTTTTTYDQAGRATDTNGPAGATHQSFDTSGRLSNETFAGSMVATPTYDAGSGLLTGIAYNANGTSLLMSRDNRGRVSKLDWRAPGNGSLASDEVTKRSSTGRVLDEKVDGNDPRAGDNFAYDNAGRLVDAWVADPANGYAAHHYTYAFDATSAGCTYSMGNNTNRTAMTVDAASTTYCYDQADKLTSSSDAAFAGITYDPRGNTTTLGAQQLTYDGSDRHVTTIGPASDTTPPAVAGAPVVSGVTATAATVTWATSEAATGYVEFGATTTYGRSADEAAGLRTSHSVVVADLVCNTSYHAAVGGADANGNASSLSTDASFTTAACPTDVTAPTISSVVATATGPYTATITWSTDEPATSNVDLGPPPTYGTTVSDGSLVTWHSVAITGLACGTSRNYRVRSTDAAGNQRTGTDASFTTTTCGPSISRIATATDSSSSSVSLSAGPISGTQAQDLVIVATTTVAGSSHANTPTGFTALADYTIGAVEVQTFSGFLTNAITSQNVTFTTKTGYRSMAVVVYRGTDGTQPVIVSAGALATSSVSNTVSVTASGRVVAVQAAKATTAQTTTSFTPPTGMTNRADVGTGTNRLTLADLAPFIVTPGNPGSYAATSTFSTPGTLALGLITLKQPPPPPGGGQPPGPPPPPTPDTTAPTVTAIGSTALTNKATVTWTTNEPATSWVDYGPTS